MGERRAVGGGHSATFVIKRTKLVRTEKVSLHLAT